MPVVLREEQVERLKGCQVLIIKGGRVSVTQTLGVHYRQGGLLIFSEWIAGMEEGRWVQRLTCQSLFLLGNYTEIPPEGYAQFHMQCIETGSEVIVFRPGVLPVKTDQVGLPTANI